VLSAEGFLTVVLRLFKAGPVSANLVDGKAVRGLKIRVLLDGELCDDLVVVSLESLVLLGPERGQKRKKERKKTVRS